MLHTRGLPADRAVQLEAAIFAAWEPIASAAELTLDRMDGGLELRARGHDKGTAARALIDRSPQGTFAAFVGDDRSDEDAFAVVSAHGAGVSVGRTSRQAALSLDAEDVVAFLDCWLDASRRAA